MHNRNIVLTGFMGTGKTTVGRLLANETGRAFYDTDDEIVKAENMEISLIFEKYGEQYFRDLEKTITQKLSFMNRTVIATGGGIVKNTENMELLSQNGIIVYLKCTPDKIYLNTIKDGKRPLLNVSDRLAAIKGMLEQRVPLYEAYCCFMVDVSEITADDAARIILDKVGQQ